jgi:hypothetical protein
MQQYHTKEERLAKMKEHQEAIEAEAEKHAEAKKDSKGKDSSSSS